MLYNVFVFWRSDKMLMRSDFYLIVAFVGGGGVGGVCGACDTGCCLPKDALHSDVDS